MKLTVRKHEEEIIDIKFPCYVKFSDHYTKIIDENTVIVVEDWEHSSKSIKLDALCRVAPFGLNGWKFITEDQFNEVHLRVSFGGRMAHFSPALNIEWMDGI